MSDTDPNDTDWNATLAAYEHGPDRLEAAVAGMTREHLHACPGPGAWSTHEVVIHLADSELTSIERMKRIVAMDRPTLLAYDETAFIRKLHADEQRLEDALLMFRLARRQWLRVVRRLTEEQLDRVGEHSENGAITVRQMVPGYVQHLEGHIEFILKKRERLGVPTAAG